MYLIFARSHTHLAPPPHPLPHHSEPQVDRFGAPGGGGGGGGYGSSASSADESSSSSCGDEHVRGEHAALDIPYCTSIKHLSDYYGTGHFLVVLLMMLMLRFRSSRRLISPPFIRIFLYRVPSRPVDPTLLRLCAVHCDHKPGAGHPGAHQLHSPPRNPPGGGGPLGAVVCVVSVRLLFALFRFGCCLRCCVWWSCWERVAGSLCRQLKPRFLKKGVGGGKGSC